MCKAFFFVVEFQDLEQKQTQVDIIMSVTII